MFLGKKQAQLYLTDIWNLRFLILFKTCQPRLNFLFYFFFFFYYIFTTSVSD